MPYLEKLGITDLYLSPILQSRAESIHGYDIINHDIINPSLGGEEQFNLLAAEVKQRDMGLILDTVPNHMCIADPQNKWWRDVLEDGPSSRRASYFDINWMPPKTELTNKVLLPFLGDQYGKVLENGEIKISYSDGAFDIHYYGLRLPISPVSWNLILGLVLERSSLAANDVDRSELESIIHSIGFLPSRIDNAEEKFQERQREKEIIRRRWQELIQRNDSIKSALDTVLKEMNGRKEDRKSFDKLEELLAMQSYRLCDWKVATDEINYRRFFDVNELAAIRVEKPEVFHDVHAVYASLFADGRAQGLRIDHVDGLLNPDKYLSEVRGLSPKPPFVIVEKILSGDEKLNTRWDIAGTTGYDFMNVLNGVFVDRDSAAPLTQFFRKFTGRAETFRDVVIVSKKLIMLTTMAGELRILNLYLDHISEQHRWSRDFTQESLRFALREVVACFPVYRSYIRPGEPINDADRRLIAQAIREAKLRNPSTTESIFDFIESVLLLNHPDGLSDEQKNERVDFILRFQQLTSPVMAKGMEDTAFYRYFPLLSLNEVGGEPDRFGVSLSAFHKSMKERAAKWPTSLSATSTHDTKRSEDARARINVLSEVHSEWIRAVRRWHRINKPMIRPSEEYLFYQTLVGSWPLSDWSKQIEVYRSRVEEFMLKAVREAKVNSSWIKPNSAYENELKKFIHASLNPANAEFISDFDIFQKSISRAGLLNTLSQSVLKIASPGIPDLYQGSELWNFTMVDPDNRRPVDYSLRSHLIETIPSPGENPSGEFLSELWDGFEDGRIKLFTIQRALHLRRQFGLLFQHGNYFPLKVKGLRKRNVVAFGRVWDGNSVVAIAGRYFMDFYSKGLMPRSQEAWADTEIEWDPEVPAGRYKDIFTGQEFEIDRTLSVSNALEKMTVALLVKNFSKHLP